MDKFQLTAIIDRLIYDNEKTFYTEDAVALRDALPKAKWWSLLLTSISSISLSGTYSGKSTQGLASGFGNVNLKEGESSFEFSTHKYVRVGQWKLRRSWKWIEIEQMMSDQDDQKCALIRFSFRGYPLRMEILIRRTVHIGEISSISIGTFCPWKTPV